VQANHLVSVLRTIIAWGIQRGYSERNPALEVVAIDILEEQNARPWPEEAFRVVLHEAPEHLRRAAYLGRVTGQRRSDLVRMGRRDRRDDGLDIRIKKLRGLRHFMPLNQAELAMLDSWECSENRPLDCVAEGQAHERRPFGGLAQALYREPPGPQRRLAFNAARLASDGGL
jgi:integrase